MTVAKSLNFYYGKFSAKFHMYTQKHIQEKERKAISYVKLQIFLKYLSLKKKSTVKSYETSGNHSLNRQQHVQIREQLSGIQEAELQAQCYSSFESLEKEMKSWGIYLLTQSTGSFTVYLTHVPTIFQNCSPDVHFYFCFISLSSIFQYSLEIQLSLHVCI